jgi:putative membrane protein
MSRLARCSGMSLLGAFVWICTGACNRGAESADSAAAVPGNGRTVGASPGASVPGEAPLNDARIAHVVLTANSIDSAAGELARRQGQSQAVKDFAQTMITDHAGVNRQATALAGKLGVTPEDNGTSQQLIAGADESAAKLQATTGMDFDRAYMDREVAYHEAVLAALDDSLVPATQNAELKALMVKVRPAFVAHLDHARRIQASLARK